MLHGLRAARLGIIGGAGALAAIIIVVAIAAANAGQVTTSPGGGGSSLQGNSTSVPSVSTPATIVDDIFHAIADPDPPMVNDSSLKVEKVVEGLSNPTSMAFVNNWTLLILQKDDGAVRLVSNGTLVPEPVSKFEVENASERGLLGLAVHGKDVFIYMTENASSGDIRERVYRFEWQNGRLEDKTMILDLPGTPGPNHDGGRIIAGPAGELYVPIGDLNRNGMLQNHKDGPAPDDTSVILKVDRDGKPLANALSGRDGLAAYYAYGVRNSFGLAIDPVTGALWDTENGPDSYDEINLVIPGFNSGWEQIMGPAERSSASVDSLVQFEGSQYQDPKFSWQSPIGVTDIAFASPHMGQYANDIFVGEINGGNLYHFKPNGDRNGLVLDGALADKVADGGESGAVVFGTGFNGITDIENGPEGYLYVLSFGDGSIYRISPAR
jgi:glucose/arabinose dehydrogenase